MEESAAQVKHNKIDREMRVARNKPRGGKGIGFLVMFAIVFAILVSRSLVRSNSAEDGAKPAELNFTQVLAASDGRTIKTLVLNGADARGELKDGTKFAAKVSADSELLQRIAKNGADVVIDDSRGWVDILGTWVSILMGVLFIWWIFRGMKMMGGHGGGIANMFGSKTKVSIGKKIVKFSDVAGIDGVKKEVGEIVDFLKNPKKYRELGARIPRGVLLSGEPGTGKTLLAKAIAGEADVPFYAVSGSDFSGIIVGLGVAKIKDFFDLARQNAPCILFIDEIDAIGAARGRTINADSDREATLNQLLIEMDGFSSTSNLIIVGATNRPDMLDPALLRPGRFDRQVYIELPDMAGRLAILELYAKKMKFAKDVSLSVAARGTTGFSGADLNNLLNEAALHAAREGRKEIDNSDIDEARDKILMGPRKERKMRPQDVKLTAYHEAGHAFLSVHYKGITDPIHKATILPRGRALGMVQYLPVDDKVSLPLEEIRARIEIGLGGRATEELFFGADKITTGAESDIASATYLARKALTAWGMSPKIGMVAVNQVESWGRNALENASQKTAEAVDAEVRTWIDSAYKRAKAILSKHKAKLKKLAEELLKRETLTSEEIEKIVVKRDKGRGKKDGGATSNN
ncbi:MAG: ATP-dependent zinc metalloprotease FtsH [Rickettsiales bacterium]|jgi:cell division protease FtsH|nr:ATP-dependent zinc metalloprotease FtsH [Rickettsiales bacterium]